MPARLRLTPHLTTEELEARYRTAARAVEMKHWQILWLLSKEWRTEDIADAVGYSVVWIRKLAGRYNEGGPEALLDGCRNNPGNPPLLDEAGRAALKRAIEEDEPPGGGQWSGPKVAAWISGYLGRPVGPVRGWDYLRRLGYTPQGVPAKFDFAGRERPRSRHKDADEAAQRAYKRRPEGAYA